MKEILFHISDMFCTEHDFELSNCDLESLLGEIILNRIVGVSYDNIRKTNRKGIPKEFIDSLKILYGNNVKKSRSFKDNLRYLSFLLKEAEFQYALLKGAFLTTALYPEGYRTSNDIDILVNYPDISKLQKILTDNEFVQGHFDMKHGIIPASRKDIIYARMNFGETVPFIKMIQDEPFMIDINFSMDFKPDSSRNIVGELLGKAERTETEDYFFYTLDPFSFLIHLCCHLFKEATTYDWVVDRRDLMLYKFCDINVFLSKYGSQSFFKELSERIKYFEVEKECFYTFENSAAIYPGLYHIEGFEEMKSMIKPCDLNYMKQIVLPAQNKVFEFEMDFIEWFFCKNRLKQLKDVTV